MVLTIANCYDLIVKHFEVLSVINNEELTVKNANVE